MNKPIVTSTERLLSATLAPTLTNSVRPAFPPSGEPYPRSLEATSDSDWRISVHSQRYALPQHTTTLHFRRHSGVRVGRAPEHDSMTNLPNQTVMAERYSILMQDWTLP